MKNSSCVQLVPVVWHS